ncbi:MAG: HEAT repeat domain-containing protein [Candidatus Binatia bacterium]
MAQPIPMWWKFFRLKSFNADTRANFAKEISESGDLRLITKLAGAVKDDDLYTIRLTAIIALGNLRDPSSTNTLIEALSDPSPAVRVAAANALGAIGNRKATEGLRSLLRDLHNEQARTAAINALGKLKDPAAVSDLLEIANDEGDAWAVRKASVEALGEIRDSRAVDSLVNTLGDQYATVREASALALGKIGSNQATLPLLATLDTSSLWALRVAAANALGAIRDRRATPPLSSALRDRYAAVREAAAGALGKLGDPDAVDPLIGSLDDPNGNVQEAVMLALDLLSEDLPQTTYQRIQAAINRRRRALIDTHEPYIMAAIMHKNAAQKAYQVIERILTKHGVRFDGDTLNDILTLGNPDTRNELPLTDPRWEENLTKPASPDKVHELAQQAINQRK